MGGAAPRVSPFLARLQRRDPTYIMGVRSARASEIARIAAATGHHALMVDLEHSGMPVSVAGEICATAGDLGLTGFVRIPEREYGIIGRVLDGGATGIVAPRIETAAEAQTIARACRFAPRGQRSQLAMVPQLGMRPMPAREMNPLLDHAVIVQVLLETPAGIANAEAIAAVPGIDILSIGCNDLCAELGIPGAYADHRLREAVTAVASACALQGKPLIVGGISDLSIMAGFMSLGVATAYFTGTDSEMLFTAADARTHRWGEWHAARNG